jgi:nucleoid DNA-binding protein
VTKKEIVQEIATTTGLPQLQIKAIVQATFDAIVETLLREKRIELRNFGVFAVKRRKARKARNPKKKLEVMVPAKNVVTFKPGKEMIEKVRKLTDVPEKQPRKKEPAAAEAASTTTAGTNSSKRPRKTRTPKPRAVEA